MFDAKERESVLFLFHKYWSAYFGYKWSLSSTILFKNWMVITQLGNILKVLFDINERDKFVLKARVCFITNHIFY